LNLTDTLQQAIIYHKAGELENAEQLYRSILTEEPNHPDANHNLGVLLKQSDKADIALLFFKTALESNTNQGQYWISYIETLMHLQQYDAAQNVLNQGQAKGLKGDAVDQLKERINLKVNPSSEPVETQSKILNVNATLARAKSHAKKGQLDETKQLYHRVLEAFSQNQQAKKSLKALQKGQVNKKNLSGPPQAQIDSVVALYSQGQLQEALDAIDTLIKDYPNEPLLYNISGVCYKALNQLGVAVKCYEQALVINPDYAEAHNNLGNTFKEVGQLGDSVKCFEQALAIKPDYAEAYYNLANTLKELDQLGAAIRIYEKALAINPNNAEAHSNLGLTFHELDQFDAAVKSYEQALLINPDFAAAHNNLGLTFKELGQLDAAVKSYEQALAIKANYSEAHNNLGNALKELGQLDAAVKSYYKALAINLGFAEAHSNLGNAFKELGQLDAAVKSYEQALVIKPDYAEAHNNLGIALKELGQLYAAIESYEQALVIKPDYAEAKNNLGNALSNLGQLDAAVKSYEQALVIKPDYAEAKNNLGNAFGNLGQLDGAVKSYEQALAIKPDYAEAHSNRLLLFNYSSNYDSDFLLKEAVNFGEIFRKKVSSHFSHFNCSHKPEKLRIGFVSGDFSEHPVGYFLENVLSELSKKNLDLIAYTTTPKFDELSARIQPCFSEWKPLYGLTDENAAKLIHNDGIHILIDLSGHTALNRLPIFFWKPAPIQISWLGYFATTGIDEIDYILGDPYVTPTSLESQFTETIYQLPKTRWCFTPPKVDINISPPPALINGYVTFGCFNNLIKMNEQVISLWIKILAAIPSSCLLLKSSQLNSLSIQSKIIKQFTTAGINPERITCEGAESREKYFVAYQRIDIALDPFPFSGGTVTMETLWMGVPVLTLQGGSLVSRQGVGILMNAGLSNWVAIDKDEYLAKAIDFASDLDQLTMIRSGLREKVLSSPLFDAKQFAKDFEQALRIIWQQKNLLRKTSG
jgi:protein O-GlcNAc transferase